MDVLLFGNFLFLCFFSLNADVDSDGRRTFDGRPPEGRLGMKPQSVVTCQCRSVLPSCQNLRKNGDVRCRVHCHMLERKEREEEKFYLPADAFHTLTTKDGMTTYTSTLVSIRLLQMQTIIAINERKTIPCLCIVHQRNRPFLIFLNGSFAVSCLRVSRY